MQPRMIADDLRVPGLARLEQPADQHMIETELRGMLELRGPRFQPSDEGRMNEVNPRRIGVRSFHRSFPDFVLLCGVDAPWCDHDRLLGFRAGCRAMRPATARTAQCSALIDMRRVSSMRCRRRFMPLVQQPDDRRLFSKRYARKQYSKRTAETERCVQRRRALPDAARSDGCGRSVVHTNGAAKREEDV
jgi:hypothetical protein